MHLKVSSTLVFLSQVIHHNLETFVSFCTKATLQHLGMIDSKASTLKLSINGKDYVVHQSPGLLASNRHGGTTGAGKFPISFHDHCRQKY